MTDAPASLAGRKVLVTGAAGFIGSRLTRRLRELGAEVHGTSRRAMEATEGGPTWWRADLADTDTARELVANVRPDAILHLASHVVGARDRDQVLPTFRSNLMSTVNLLLAASENECSRVVLTGSLEEPDPGDVAAVPSSPYAAAKWAATGYARLFHALYDLDVVVLRVFMVYGPAQADLRKLIPYVTLALLRGETPRLSSGQRPVDWIYVDDVVEGFVAAAGAPGVGGQVLDIGSGSLVTVREVVERLAPLVRPEAAVDFGALPDRPLEQVRVADPSRARASLGWQPRVSLEEGLRRTVEWYRKLAPEGSVPASSDGAP